MNIKKFYLNIEDEQIFFEFVPLEDDGSIQEQWINKDFILSNNPEIINITHLNYVPVRLSIWNGTDFIAPEGKTHSLQDCKDKCSNGCVSFALVKDGISYGTNGYCVGSNNNDMMIAALSSNPTITYEIVESE
jgi:hypothetical protein